jgi:zinc transport system permease protein
MNTDLLFDPLFAQPFATGLAFAILLPLLGCYLRLRDEWLAALAFAQSAAAGSLLAMLAGLPLALGGLAAAALAAALKHAFEGATRGTQGAAYAMLLLLGWGISVLLVANLPLAERMGHALFDGQLYFTDRSHLIAAGCRVACCWRIFSPTFSAPAVYPNAARISPSIYWWRVRWRLQR